MGDRRSGNVFVTFGTQDTTEETFGVRITRKEMQPMSDQQEIQRQTALRLRGMASGFLGSAAGIDDPELKRKLTRWAFELAREAIGLEPIGDQAEFGSLSPSGASNPAAHVRNPKMLSHADLTAQWIDNSGADRPGRSTTCRPMGTPRECTR